MPSFDPSKAAANPQLDLKKVSWLELFFDVIFALALAMSAKGLENLTHGDYNPWMAFGEFVIMFLFLIIFWYRHMALINRFKRLSFLAEALTLFIGFLVIVFTQFIRVWRTDPVIGSRLATITIFLISLSLAALYFLFSLKMMDGGENEKRWTRAHSKRMLLESLGYLTALIATPVLRPFWFIAVFIYFNRLPFVTWLNPKAKPDLPPELQNVPPENIPHKSERMGLFSLLIYGLIIVLAATPLMEINISSAEGILEPITVFGKILFFITIIWFIHFKLFELAQPKGHQFTAMNFITLFLLVSSTQFIRMLMTEPSVLISILFAASVGIMFSIIGTKYWNIKMMAGIPPSEDMQVAFRRWAFLLYGFAIAFFASIIFLKQPRIMELIWQITLAAAFLGLLLDRGLSTTYYMGTRLLKNRKYLDTPTVTGLAVVFIGLISFFVVNVLLGKPLTSWWLIIWLIPAAIGFFLLINHWLFKRIRPN